MTATADGWTDRVTRWWTRRYTAGLPSTVCEARRLEIDSDLSEHRKARDDEGWGSRQIAGERLTRLIGGMSADLGWRRDVLTQRARSVNGFLRVSILTVTTAASVLLAIFHVAFSAYVLGRTSLADQRFLGGFDSYADKVDNGVESTVGALVLVCIAMMLLIASLSRPISPFMANLVTVAVAMPAVLFFWLGTSPVALVAVFGSVVDMILRAPQLSTALRDP